MTQTQHVDLETEICKGYGAKVIVQENEYGVRLCDEGKNTQTRVRCETWMKQLISIHVRFTCNSKYNETLLKQLLSIHVSFFVP